MGKQTDNLRLVGPPETNKVMAAELSRLSRRCLSRVPPKPRRPGSGTLIFPMDEELAWLATRYHRTSARVLWDLYETRANRLEPLYEEVRALVSSGEKNWLTDGMTISVDARNVDAFAAGPRQIVGAVKNALIEGAEARGFGIRVDPETPDVRLWVRGQDDTLSISVDLTGHARHLRGYRLTTGAAPLREPMAAAMVMLSRWDARSELLLDPMAGSGTIAIEAALMAAGRPLTAEVGELAMAALPRFATLAAREAPPLFGDTWPTIVTGDIDPAMMRATRANAERAGVSDAIVSQQVGVADLRPADVLEAAERAGRATDRGVILVNPPFGERLDPDDLLDIYGELGRLCRSFPGWRAGVLAGNPAFVHAFGHTPRVTKPMRTGAMRVNFFLFDL